MSDVDPTPETPVTLGDRMAWWREDMAARLTTLEAQVAALSGEPGANIAGLRTDLAALSTDLAALSTDLAALRGTGQRDLSQLYSGLYVEGEVVDYPAHISSRLKLDDIIGHAEDIKSHWAHGQGLTAYALLDGIYMLLTGMSQNLAILTGGQSPVLTPNDVENAGEQFLEGRLYALWFDSPGSGITVDQEPIYLTGNWTGWFAYIQTTDPLPRIAGSDTPANQWIALPSSTQTINFSVAAGYPIRVYLRAPAVPVQNDYYEWIGAEVYAATTAAGIRYVPVRDKYPDLQWTYDAPRNTWWMNNDPDIWSGWQYEITGGGTAYRTVVNDIVSGSVSNSTVRSGLVGNFRYLILQTTNSPATRIALWKI